MNRMQRERLKLKAQLQGGVIVSCQALTGEPLRGATIMAHMAVAAQQGGAVGIRANGPADIRAIRSTVSLPVIGLFKDGDDDIYITPTWAHACMVADAGADVIALDGTQRPRPDGGSLKAMIKAIHAKLGKLTLADVSTLEEGLAAEAAGADFVATTLAGYTPYSAKNDGPDLDLVQALANQLRVPVIAEGRISTPAAAKAAIEAGALAVVVGTAITRPQWITAQFVAALE